MFASTKRGTLYPVRACAASMIVLLWLATAARADIFQWEYINPSEPGEGKQQSLTLAPDGAGVVAEPGADLTSLDLTKAYLSDANLEGAYLYYSNLTDADFRQANL